MPFGRTNPSPRYRELVELYRRMHLEGERFLNLPPQKVFSGFELHRHVPRVRRLIALTGAASILDYGSGKGQQYEGPVRLADGASFDNVQDYWDVDFVHCYDPSYPPFSKLPAERFDGVVSTDVLEHCPEEDVEWIVGEIFGFARRFVFANVACFPAKKRLPTGENAHCTVKPLAWWSDLVTRVAAGHPGVLWEFWIETQEPGPDGPQYAETRIGNAEGAP